MNLIVGEIVKNEMDLLLGHAQGAQVTSPLLSVHVVICLNLKSMGANLERAQRNA